MFFLAPVNLTHSLLASGYGDVHRTLFSFRLVADFLFTSETLTAMLGDSGFFKLTRK